MPEKPDQKTIRRMLDDVEAVTKSRFHEAPDYLVSPRELFRTPKGKPYGEPFAALRAREQRDVLWIYVPSYEEHGISREQMEQVFRNIVIEEKPRAQWLDGTGLDGRPAATPITMEEVLAVVHEALERRDVQEKQAGKDLAERYRTKSQDAPKPARKNSRGREM